MSEKNLIYGFHAIEALLLKQPERIVQVYLQDSALKKERQDHKLQKIFKTLKDLAISYELVNREVLERMTAQANHQGIAAHCTKARTYAESELKSLIANIQGPPLLLILDGVQDPHNLGACLRTADAAGVHAVIAPKDKSVGLTSTVVKVACGAAETVPFVQITNLARVMNELKEQGIWIFGLADDAEKTIYEEDLKLPTALVLGNEEKGMRHLTREHCDIILQLPMHGFVSSLNVSVATGVALFEANRQRHLKS